MDAPVRDPDVRGVSPYVLSLKKTLLNQPPAFARFEIGELSVELIAGVDSVWAIIRRPGSGSAALRVAYLAGEFECDVLPINENEQARLRIDSAVGTHSVVFEVANDAIELLRMTVRLKSIAPMVVPFMPRDLYPLDAHDDPLGAVGTVEAAQRGLNGGLIYFHVDEPAFGTVLYFQNLTALNEYYRVTKTKPDGAVGGEWPELGFLLPTPPQSGTPPTDPLPAGKEIILSDAVIAFRKSIAADERESALQFLQMLAAIYPWLDRPSTEYRDWTKRATRTLRDLSKAPEATVTHYGHRYVHPYTAAEYPDVMVQTSLIRSIHEWGKWKGKPHALEAELKTGLGRFFDKKLRTFRRYLPNVGDDKDKDAVDSWYLYHPLLNLAALALDGDARARDLFLESLEFGIKAAHHFKYKWPIQYKITDFSVIVEAAESSGRGQTDVTGIYAWVMLEAFELTRERRFLKEARAAIESSMGLKFNLNYQANLTAWGAAACVRLWRMSGERTFLAQSYVYLASFFHNCQIWESEIELAVHYHNFLGATCLQDAPYMAMYECFESFAAFQRYLRDGGDELDPGAAFLLTEYCKYALDRAWSYYPDALPAEAISEKQRESNGHIDPTLAFPLEDLYADGQPAGQVGQEIYGAGAAFIFASAAFHRIKGAPFLLCCDHFVREMDVTENGTVKLKLEGRESSNALMSLVPVKGSLPAVKLFDAAHCSYKPDFKSAKRLDFRVPTGGHLFLYWKSR